MTELQKVKKEISSLKNNLKERKKKKERAEKIKKIKENKIKRKKRAVHLFILGNVLKSSELDNLNEETLIGYCLSFQKITPLKLDQYKITGKQILAEKQIERDKKRERLKYNFFENTGQSRSFTNKEYSRMIRLGAIFEMAKIDKIDLGILFGFILDFKNKNNIEKNNFYLDGKLFKLKKEETKNKNYNTKK